MTHIFNCYMITKNVRYVYCMVYAEDHHLVFTCKKSVMISFKKKSDELEFVLNGNVLPTKGPSHKFHI